MAKACGGCTLCCWLPSIKAIQKPAGTMCVHCTPNSGCKIYQDRPSDCRVFNCVWLTGKLGDKFRPDRLGILFEPYHEYKTVIAMAVPGANWRSGLSMKLISQISKDGYTVWVIEGSDRNLFLRKGDTKEQALSVAKSIWKEVWQLQPTAKI